MQITAETTAAAPLERVWKAYTTPHDICQWNAASSDWHTIQASVDLRAGGAFSSRMEAKDGSMGFDFAGTYTRVVPLQCIEYRLGERVVQVQFEPVETGVRIRVIFDAEDEYSAEQQRQGWQAILENFANYVAEQAS